VSQRRIRRFLAGTDRAMVAERWPIPASLAIVVPCFGHAPYLPTMFESIVLQTRPADEVVLVEDHSPDDSASILAGLIAGRPDPTDGRFSLLRNDRNVGQAASLNRGIAALQSDLVMVLNDDDYLMHDAVALTLERFANYPDLALVGAHSIHFAGDEALAAAPKTSDAYPGAGRSLIVHRPVEVPGYRSSIDLNMTHSGSCFRRVAWVVVGGYYADSRKRIVVLSDRDFQIRINALWPVGIATDAPLSFWRSDSSVDAGRNS
jgi:glycosyltransferase involved in cell wall biosynthesis